MNRSIFLVLISLSSSLLLAAMPATGYDYCLDIFGNANVDDTIDEQDVEYVQGIINGTNEATELADANYDGRIDEDDLSQIELIIAGEEDELTLVDSADRTVTVELPITKIAALHTSPCREFCMLGVQDKVVGVSGYIFDDPDMYPGLEDKENIGSSSTPDYEIIAEIKPDILICQIHASYLDPVVNAVEPIGIQVVSLDLRPPQGGMEQELQYDLELKKLGYLLGTVERANDFIDWRHEIMQLPEERVGDLDEEEKVRVLCLDYTSVATGNTEFYYGWGQRFINMSGGINIAGGLPISGKVSGEWVLEQDPDVIIMASCYPKEGFGYSVTDTTLAEESLSVALDHSVLRETTAAKDGNLYIYSYYGLASGGQTQLGALYLAKRIYPELFEEIDPEEFHIEYFEEWFGIPYQGVWFYP